MIELILGGARSGKSRYAENIANSSSKTYYYFATAQALDTEMQQRIQRHKADRHQRCTTIEEPIALAKKLQQYDDKNHLLLVDCLTLWVTNCLLATQANCWQTQKQQLLEYLPTCKADILLVSNETSLGIVPIDALSRQFIDEAGRLHQAIAQIADKVTFIAAGLPLTLKSKTL